MTGRVAGAVLRYLAVAHFGRGRGDYVAAEYPPHWGAVVDAAVSTQRATLDEIWSAAAAGVTADALESRLRPLLEAVASDVLGACTRCAPRRARPRPPRRTRGRRSRTIRRRQVPWRFPG